MSRMIQISYYRAVSCLLCIGETMLFLFSVHLFFPTFLLRKYVCMYVYTYTDIYIYIYIMRVHYVPGIVPHMWFIGKQNETVSKQNLHTLSMLYKHRPPYIHLKIFLKYLLCSRHYSCHVQDSHK